MGVSGLIALLALAAGPAEGRLEMFDCGPMALSILLRLEGKADDPRAIVATLPPRSKGGYSMLELRDAAKGLGLTLTGVKVGRGDHTPDRPLLALLDKKPDGHFVVVRPVGSTGKLVQVIDPQGQLEILDASALFASAEWTGMALIPSRLDWPLRVGIAVGLGSFFFLARLLAIKAHWRGTGGSIPG